MNNDSNETIKKTAIKASDHESYNTYSIIAFLIPLVGFILGIVYLTKDAAIDKKLGENLIAFSVFGAIVGGIVWYMFLGQVVYMV